MALNFQMLYLYNKPAQSIAFLMTHEQLQYCVSFIQYHTQF